MKERHDRGEYRPIFVALVHGPSFLKLSKWARALWYPIKLQLGPLGIAAVPGAVGVFADLTGLSFEEVDRARAELVAGNWLRIEGNVWWLVRGLEFEPQLDAKNQNHVTFVRREWGKVPNLAIRAEFVAAYPQWFEGMGYALPNPSKGPPKAPPITAPAPAPIPATTKAAATAREALATAFGPETGTVAAFLDRTPADQRYAWERRLLGYLEGLDLNGGRATPAIIGRALRDLEGGPLPGPAKVRRFIELAMKHAAHPVGAGAPAGETTANQVDRAVRRLETKRAAR